MVRHSRHARATQEAARQEDDQHAIRILSQASPVLDVVTAQLHEIVTSTEEAAIGVLTEAQDADTEAEALVSFARNLAERNGENSQRVAQAAQASADQVERIVAAVTERYTAVLGLVDDVRGLQKYVDAVAAVSGATNILALNARIEAVRAGDAGAGFAVVATEVQALSKQSAAAADAVRQGIARVSAAMAQRLGDKDAAASGSSFGAINDQLQSIASDQRGLADMLSATVTETHAAVQHIEASADSLNQRTSAIVARAQFQDLARQSVESVVTALSDLDSRLVTVANYLTHSDSAEALASLGDAVHDMSATYTSQRQRTVHAETTTGRSQNAGPPDKPIELF